MDKEVIEKLNKINEGLYENAGEDFSQTRQYPWPGWKKVISFLDGKDFTPKNILDVGCGNGRFHPVIQGQYPDIRYVGIDSSSLLVSEAEDSYPDAGFVKMDIFSYLDLPNETEFDLITSFALFHHIPGRKRRSELMKKLKKRLSLKGYFIISFWKFLEDERLKEKVIDWKEVGFNKNDVEENDYLLSWGNEDTKRYCHYFDEEEIDQLVEESGFQIVHHFRADGKSGELNRYVILNC